MPKGESNRKLSPEQWAVAVAEYATPLPDGTWQGATTIARKYSVRTGSLYYHLRRAGVPTRDASEAHAHGKRCKPIKNLPIGNPPDCACGCGHTVEWNQRKNRWNRYAAGHYRRNAPYKNRDWLAAQYADHTLTQIANECMVNVSTIARYMDLFGIPRRSHSEALRLSGAVSGERNPAWNGGTTPERQRLYKTGAWKESVRAAFARDGYRCRICGAPKTRPKSLHTHHIKPWSSAPDSRFDVDNLVTLCASCHRWVHGPENTGHLFR